MGAPRVTAAQKRDFVKHLQEGSNVKEAGNLAGFSYSTARRLAEELRSGAETEESIVRVPLIIPEPLTLAEMSDVARDCLEDFGRFRHRYFGRISSPWQEDAANNVRIRLNSPYKEYGVVNCPPGSGKSTLFTHDIPAWLTARSRSLRGFIGSSTGALANSYVGRLRSTLERPIPMQAKSEDLSRGLAVDAASSLPIDYGRFRPDVTLGDPPAPWSKTQITVVQHGFTLTDEKESTWTAFGMDTGFLGWRVNFIVWDDLVTKRSLTTEEIIAAQRVWWINEAETRLEPGGLLILQGQRLHAEDLYRFCLDMQVTYDDLDEHLVDIGEEVLPTESKYFHIVYKAHYEDRCQTGLSGTGETVFISHRRNAKPYDPHDPESGCLLDPVRLPMRELKAVMDQPLTNYRVVYQQEDVDPEEVLVPRIWIDGGTDFQGNDVPGCWDDSFNIGIPPKNLVGTKLSIVTVDPSPTKWWSIQWWLYVEPPGCDRLMGNRYLLDMIRAPMDAPDLLDWSTSLGTWTGLLTEWQDRARDVALPINYLIVEKNAAQRFLMQYEWFRRWCSMNNVMLRPHSTTTNKTDEEFGVKTIRNHYKFGRVRFPGSLEGRRMVAPLITELTRYPESSTDDCVMANWFLEFQLQFLVALSRPIGPVYNDLPSWLARDVSFA